MFYKHFFQVQIMTNSRSCALCAHFARDPALGRYGISGDIVKTRYFINKIRKDKKSHKDAEKDMSHF